MQLVTVTYWPAPYQVAGHDHQHHTWQLIYSGIAFQVSGADASMAGHLIQMSWDECGVSRLSALLNVGRPFGFPVFSMLGARARHTRPLRYTRHGTYTNVMVMITRGPDRYMTRLNQRWISVNTPPQTLRPWTRSHAHGSYEPHHNIHKMCNKIISTHD